MGLSDAPPGSGNPSDRGPGRMQGYCLLAKVDAGLRIGGEGGSRASVNRGLNCRTALKPAPNCAWIAGQEMRVGLLS